MIMTKRPARCRRKTEDLIRKLLGNRATTDLADDAGTQSLEEFLGGRGGGVRRRQRNSQAVRYAREITFEIPLFSPEDLLEYACDHYAKISGNPISSSDPELTPGFLARILVNFLRHQATWYDYYIERIKSFSKDCPAAMLMLRRKLFRAIAEVYPWLGEECRRQYMDRHPCSSLNGNN